MRSMDEILGVQTMEIETVIRSEEEELIELQATQKSHRMSSD